MHPQVFQLPTSTTRALKITQMLPFRAPDVAEALCKAFREDVAEWQRIHDMLVSFQLSKLIAFDTVCPSLNYAL